MRRAASVLVVLIAAVVVVSAHAEGDTAPNIKVVGTEFRVTLRDGRQLTGDGLLGTILTFADPSAAQRRLRIEAVQPDPKDSSGEIILYRLSIGRSEHGHVGANLRHRRHGLPVERHLDADGRTSALGRGLQPDMHFRRHRQLRAYGLQAMAKS